MGIPAQIQRQIDEADALHKQIYEQGEQPTVEEQQKPAADENTVPVGEIKPETPAPVKAEQDQEEHSWRQRYNSLQGMFGNLTHRLQTAEAKNAELSEKLQEAIAKMEQASKVHQQSEPQGPLVTDKDAEAFGTDLIDLARRVAKEQFGEREQNLLDHISRLESALKSQSEKLGTVAQTQAVSAQERFFTSLDSALGDWEKIQATPECQAWLSSRVPGTTYTWNQALLDAGSSYDSSRAIEVFDTFLKAHPALDMRRKPEPQSKRSDVTRQVAPSKSATATSTPSGKRSYSSAEWAAEMDKVRLMNKSRQYDDAVALENELNAALAEGRVSP